MIDEQNVELVLCHQRDMGRIANLELESSLKPKTRLNVEIEVM